MPLIRKLSAAERTPRFRTLSGTLELLGDQLPTEFLIFKPGVNATRKGDFLFDQRAARAVMAEYQKGGVQLCLDLEHDSLDPERRKARADASDAMGWYDLALKSDGSLWAVNVAWSSEGERRLRGKLQRYTSPAYFVTESKDAERPRRLINVALCAMPATLDNEPLVAASDLGLPAHVLAHAKSSATSSNMALLKKKKPAKSAVQLSLSAEEAKQAVDLLSSKDGEAALAFVAQVLATSAAGGDAAADESDPGVAESADPAPADAPPKPAASPSSIPPAPAKASAAPDPKAKAYAMTMLAELTGVADPAKAIERFRLLNDRVTKLAEDEAATELTARRDLIGKLVQLGYETPASAWEGKPEDRTPKARFLAEPVAEMRARVADLEKRPIHGHQSPEVLSSDVTKLSAVEIANCKKANITPEEYITRKQNAVRRSS